MLGKRYFSQLRSRRQSLPFPRRGSSPYRIRACHTRTAGPDWPPCDPSRAASPLEIQRPGPSSQNTLDLDPFVATFFFRAGPPPLSKGGVRNCAAQAFGLAGRRQRWLVLRAKDGHRRTFGASVRPLVLRLRKLALRGLSVVRAISGSQRPLGLDMDPGPRLEVR